VEQLLVTCEDLHDVADDAGVKIAWKCIALP